jgi:hypothetical protein
MEHGANVLIWEPLIQKRYKIYSFIVKKKTFTHVPFLLWSAVCRRWHTYCTYWQTDRCCKPCRQWSCGGRHTLRPSHAQMPRLHQTEIVIRPKYVPSQSVYLLRGDLKFLLNSCQIYAGLIFKIRPVGITFVKWSEFNDHCINTGTNFAIRNKINLSSIAC